MELLFLDTVSLLLFGCNPSEWFPHREVSWYWSQPVARTPASTLANGHDRPHLNLEIQSKEGCVWVETVP